MVRSADYTQEELDEVLGKDPRFGFLGDFIYVIE
jgi:hypothetical protein